MKAWKVKEHGGVEKLLLEEVDTPVLQPSTVRLKVLAAGINHLDVWVRKGVPGHKFPLPLILGSDVVGEITEIDSAAKSDLSTRGLKQGSRVLVYPVSYCGECVYCKEGHEQLCAKFGLIGESENGGLCEEIVVPAARVLPVPGFLSDTEAAAIPIAGITAWSMVKKSRIGAGDWILIHAAGSGVSSYAIQMAKSLGAKVISTVGSADKIHRAEEIGADFVFSYKDKNLRDEVKRILKENTACALSAVIDHVGKDTFSESLKLLGKGGSYVFCGATSGAEAQVNLNLLFFKNISVIGSTMGSLKDFQELMKVVSDKKVKPLVDRSFVFNELKEAHEYIESRKGFGKVVLCMS